MNSPTREIDGSGPTRLDVEVRGLCGLHARVAALFVRVASQFDCEILVEKDGTTVNGKSILGLLTLAAGRGTTLTILAVGRDSVQALGQLGSLLEDGEAAFAIAMTGARQGL